MEDDSALEAAVGDVFCLNQLFFARRQAEQPPPTPLYQWKESMDGSHS
jgi:hypothetical protein